MKIYFINNNVEDPINTVQKIIDVKMDIILSSPMARERRIASVVSDVINVPFKTTSILSERKQPNFIIGRFQSGSFSSGLSSLSFKQTDNESFKELKLRSKIALSLFDTLNLDTILIVVSHNFQSVLLAYMLFGENLNRCQYLSLFKFLKTSDSPITISQKCSNYWKLLSPEEASTD